MLKVFFKKLSDSAIVPQKMTNDSAGYDIYSSNEKDIILHANSLELIPTGLSIQLPTNYEAQIRPRSGLALKNKITVLNTPGTIDPDYRGEVKVILYNFDSKDFVIKKHTRIAQMVISKFENVEFTEAEELSETQRSSGGFGHTKI